MILELIGMIFLGLLSAVLSFYNKNYYVRIFDDILGREEDQNLAVRVGRGFLYGFLFPIFFALILFALMALVSFLIVAGIVAAVVFVLVWIMEKLLPNEWIGDLILNVFSKVGFHVPSTTSNVPAPATQTLPTPVATPESTPTQSDKTETPTQS